jgi:hypothetical protein
VSDYYTNGCISFPVNAEQKVFANKVHDCILDEDIDLLKNHKTEFGKLFDNDVYRVAKKIAKFLGSDYSDDSMANVGFDLVDVRGGFQLQDDGEFLNIGSAAYFVNRILKYFDLDYGVPMQVAHTCSKHEVSGFCGTAAYVTKREIRWLSTNNWLEKQSLKNKVRLAKIQ